MAESCQNNSCFILVQLISYKRYLECTLTQWILCFVSISGTGCCGYLFYEIPGMFRASILQTNFHFHIHFHEYYLIKFKKKFKLISVLFLYSSFGFMVRGLIINAITLKYFIQNFSLPLFRESYATRRFFRPFKGTVHDRF